MHYNRQSRRSRRDCRSWNSSWSGKRPSDRTLPQNCETAKVNPMSLPISLKVCKISLRTSWIKCGICFRVRSQMIISPTPRQRKRTRSWCKRSYAYPNRPTNISSYCRGSAVKLTTESSSWSKDLRWMSSQTLSSIGRETQRPTS